jgi:membrane protease YdiL (CAAX protease family)
MFSRSDYLQATRHPWSCVLFVLPLLVVYETCVLLLRAVPPETLRNGADVWLRWVLGTAGLTQLFWAPLLLLAILGLWSWLRRGDQPKATFEVCLGMTVESVVFALGLWGLCQGMAPLFDRLDLSLQVAPDPTLQQIVSFIGAGIYEEALFRLILFTAMVWIFRLIEVPRWAALVVAGLISAVLFAAAHNLGPHGEPLETFVFLFRTLAGLYFALIYHVRGFGVAVGAHTGYDVLVGVLVDL